MSKTASLNIAKFQLIRTALKVSYNTAFMFKVFATQSTTKLFVDRVYQLMRCQLLYCTKTL